MLTQRMTKIEGDEVVHFSKVLWNCFLFYFNILKKPFLLSGTFSVEPSNGTAVDTEFTFRANLFTDDPDDYPLKYSFGYFEKKDGEEVQTYLGFQNPQTSKRATLPQGLFNNQPI